MILPEDNEKDLDEIPQQIKDELQFIFVKQIDEVLKETM